MTTISFGTMYAVAQSSIYSLTTSERYQTSLDIRSKHTLRLNICYKSIKSLSISITTLYATLLLCYFIKQLHPTHPDVYKQHGYYIHVMAGVLDTT